MPRSLNAFKNVGDLTTPRNLTPVAGDRRPELSQWGRRPPVLAHFSCPRQRPGHRGARLSRPFTCSASSSPSPAQHLAQCRGRDVFIEQVSD